MIEAKSYLCDSMSELESLGLETPKLNELNDFYEVGNFTIRGIQIDARIHQLNKSYNQLSTYTIERTKVYSICTGSTFGPLRSQSVSFQLIL